MLCNVPPNTKEEIRSVSKCKRLLKFSSSDPRTLLIAWGPYSNMSHNLSLYLLHKTLTQFFFFFSLVWPVPLAQV
jgi:hypothetical protein